ncbi:uncharacterized protein LOC143290716 [Babylonia areolata]|uniref:uncharacterized protein LOC143290716 n=1 Tax=Babylonia areolata TaxID=304850 RepID=UPI003FD3D08C
MWMTPLSSQTSVSGAVSSNTTIGENTYINNATIPTFFIPCDNPRNVISPRAAEVVDLVVYVGIMPVMVTSGVITNVINMIVFARQGLSDRIHLCLFCLAVSDRLSGSVSLAVSDSLSGSVSLAVSDSLSGSVSLAVSDSLSGSVSLAVSDSLSGSVSLAVSDTGFLLFLMCGKSYAVISLLDPVAGNYWLQRHNGPVLGSYLAFMAISNTITALIAVERCICILSPLKAAQIFKIKYMRVGIIVVAAYILVLENVCVSLKYETVEVSNPLTNTSTFVARLTPFYTRHRNIIDVFYTYMLLLIIPCVSPVVVVVCTTAITIRLRMAANWRRRTASSMTSSEKQEVSVIRMLVTVCCVYVVCMIPYVAKELALYPRVDGFLISGFLCNAFKVTIAGASLFEAFNSSVNFWIYIRQSSRYRSTFRQLCGCVTRGQRKKKGHSS